MFTRVSIKQLEYELEISSCDEGVAWVNYHTEKSRVHFPVAFRKHASRKRKTTC